MSTSVAPVNQGASSSGIHEPLVMPQNYQHYDPFNEMNDMITDTLGFNVPNYVPNVIDDPNDDEYDADVNVERPNEEARSYGGAGSNTKVTSQNDNTRQSSSSQPQQSNHRNHPSSSRDTSEETPSHHLASPVLLPTLSSSFFDVLCPIDNRAGTLKEMGKLALFFEFVLMGIWMKFVALLGNGG
ncbi:hypothetical protein QL285_091093 [Trifolium repens]|nr:hypothetical protein QL285_091093 [Trifolium repens]